MNLTGKHYIGHAVSADSSDTFHAKNPATGEDLPTAFHEATSGEIDRAMSLAAHAFNEFRHTSAERRAAFLEAIAHEVEALGDALLELTHAETGLPMPRLTGERGRATSQARLFAELAREGSWVDARIDLPQPDRQPLPKPDVRSLMQPVGPVVVFGASNFPLAISVIGADTVSALAAGCPVVIKSHPGHPGTCEAVAQAVVKAAEDCGLPEGVFSLVQGKTNAVGMALVEHPKTQAVAFTGSLRGGRALYDVACSRPHPIPFYAEMGSVNPVFVLPGALANGADALASGFVQSLTLGTGQFCTNPGLVFGMKSESFGAFISASAENAAAAAPSTMLHPGIHQAYNAGVVRLRDIAGVKVAGQSSTEADAAKAQAAVYLLETDSETLRQNPALFEEVFGPVSTAVNCQDAGELEEFANKLEGSLTATLHGTPEDLESHKGLIEILETKVGRLIFNGYPTGIEVCHGMHHGGPYPATTHSYFTSIGTRCIYRFVRPVCYQGWPQESLPEELRNDNPRKIWRMVDGKMTKDPVA